MRVYILYGDTLNVMNECVARNGSAYAMRSH